MSQPPAKLTLIHSFLISHLIPHLSSSRSSPLIVGINGIQGSGKTTLVTHLHRLLESPNPTSSTTSNSTPPTHTPLRALTLSLDDFYHPHSTLASLRFSHPQNRLLRTRGQPGTHDIPLLLSVLQSLKEGRDTKVPGYDKSAHEGEGDRIPEHQWGSVSGGVDVVVLEGWCTGFRPLYPSAIPARWEASREALQAEPPPEPGSVEAKRREGRLGSQNLEDLLVVDKNLEAYDAVTDTFDCFVHLDAEETGWVYEWRLEQEAQLRREKGKGMTESKVVEFVNGYYPSYELYTERLREGVMEGKGKQLRVVIGRDRQATGHFVV